MAIMTPTFEAGIYRLDSIIRCEKLNPCCVYLSGSGNPTVKQFLKDGSTVTLSLVDGEWRKLEAVDV